MDVVRCAAVGGGRVGLAAVAAAPADGRAGRFLSGAPGVGHQHPAHRLHRRPAPAWAGGGAESGAARSARRATAAAAGRPGVEGGHHQHLPRPADAADLPLWVSGLIGAAGRLPHRPPLPDHPPGAHRRPADTDGRAVPLFGHHRHPAPARLPASEPEGQPDHQPGRLLRPAHPARHHTGAAPAGHTGVRSR